MDFIKANWKQGLVAVCSVGVAALLLTHRVTPSQAVALGAVLTALGIHLPEVVYKAGDK